MKVKDSVSLIDDAAYYRVFLSLFFFCILLVLFFAPSPARAYEKNLRSGTLVISHEERVRVSRSGIEMNQSTDRWQNMGQSEFTEYLGHNIGEMAANMLPFMAGGIYGLIETTRQVKDVQRGVRSSTGIEVGGAPVGGPGAWFERSF